jgi:hypothetical protein
VAAVGERDISLIKTDMGHMGALFAGAFLKPITKRVVQALAGRHIVLGHWVFSPILVDSFNNHPNDAVVAAPLALPFDKRRQLCFRQVHLDNVYLWPMGYFCEQGFRISPANNAQLPAPAFVINDVF